MTKVKCKNCLPRPNGVIEVDDVKDPHCFECGKEIATTPIQETWQENPVKVAINDYGNACVKITMEFIRKEIDINTRDKKWLNEAIKLSEQIETLLQRKERETIKRVMEVRPKTELLGQVRGLEDAETMFANTRLIGLNQALQEWTDNITKLK